MQKVIDTLPAVARIILGLAFFVFGLNGFLHFMPMPPMPDAASAFMGALAETGYFFPLLKTTETVAGALLLSGRLVPLALTLLAPVVVNIVAFHVALAPSGVAMPLVLAVLGIYLAWAYRDAFRGVLKVNAKPRPRASEHGEATSSGYAPSPS
jgi:uncharacterized membrane protein YphA (DoxX/SURF4 family)